MITVKQAEWILKIIDRTDYTVDKCYENGFKAIRTNEYCKTELYCEFYADDYNKINEDNYYNFITYVTMVIERYK